MVLPVPHEEVDVVRASFCCDEFDAELAGNPEEDASCCLQQEGVAEDLSPVFGCELQVQSGFAKAVAMADS